MSYEFSTKSVPPEKPVLIAITAVYLVIVAWLSFYKAQPGGMKLILGASQLCNEH